MDIRGGGFGSLITNILGIDLQNYPHLNFNCQNPSLFLFSFFIWGLSLSLSLSLTHGTKTIFLEHQKFRFYGKRISSLC